MNEEDIEELKRLFYSNRLTQYGKRKLIEYYEQRIEELEKENEIYKEELEKIDKEISKLKNNNKDLLRKLRNRVKEVKKLEKYSTYKKEFSTLNKQLKKKDKMIDLMAEELVKAHEWFYSEFDNYTKEDFIKYFEKKAEEDK